MDDVEKRSQLVDLVQLAGQERRQIEAKAIDPHVDDDPVVPQAVHDHLQHARGFRMLNVLPQPVKSM